MLKWNISAEWKFPSPPCLQGNGVENDRVRAINLLENQCSIRESVKSGFNDVWRFLRGGEEMLHGVWDWRADVLGMCSDSGATTCYIKAVVLCSISAPYSVKFKVSLSTFRILKNEQMCGWHGWVWGDGWYWYAPLLKKWWSKTKIKGKERNRERQKKIFFSFFFCSTLNCIFPPKTKKYGWTMRLPRGATID